MQKRFHSTTSPSTKQKLWKELIQIEKSLHKSRQESISHAENRAISSIKKKSKYFFSYAKKFAKTSTCIGPLKDINNKYIHSNKEIADILSSQYKSVFSVPETACPPKEVLFNSPSTLNNITFSPEDFIIAINELSPTAGSGPDGLPTILIKKCKSSFSKALHILWTTCYDAEMTPASLKHSHIIPKFKDGLKSLPENYRPIALTSHIVKIFEKVVRTKITNYLEENNLFNDNQHGFRQSRSCLSQLLAHYDQITELLETDTGVDVIYLDFSKAFDRVDFETLLQKLNTLGIGEKIGRWIHSFLTNRTQSVIVNKTSSSTEDVLSGVPQGSVLGPLLFVIMISDIDTHVRNSTVRCFADDSRISKGITNVADATQLQIDLEAIYEWASTNKMKFNDKQFELIRYRTPRNPIQDFTSYLSQSGQVIQEKAQVKDLGILMTNNCSFAAQAKKVISTLRNMASWILRTFKARDRTTLVTSWKSLVQPINDYCCILWSPYQAGLINQMESIQWSYLRKCNNVRVNDYWDALKKHKTSSLQRRRERYFIIYTFKIIHKLVPPTGLIIRPSARRGKMLAITTTNHTSTARYHSFNMVAPRIWNSLPASIRNLPLTTIDSFKHHLDKILHLIPDEPHIPSLIHKRRADSNSIPHMIHLSFPERNLSAQYPTLQRTHSG